MLMVLPWVVSNQNRSKPASLQAVALDGLQFAGRVQVVNFLADTLRD
jgi:hypothetical protein